jgi:hypothetical protein
MSVLALALGMLLQAPASTPRVAPDSGAPPAAPPAVLNDLARLRTAKGRPSPEGQALPAAQPAEYLVDLTARSSVTYLLPAGPRTVRRLEVVPTPGTADAWQAARLRLNWESDDPGASQAGLDLPLGLAFGRSAVGALTESSPVGSNGPAWVNRLPMPYRTRATLRIDTDRPLMGRIRLSTTQSVPADAGYLRATSWRSGAPTGVEPIREPGRGHVVGLVLVSEHGVVNTERNGEEAWYSSPQTLGRLVLDDRVVGPLAAAVGLPGPAREVGNPQSPGVKPFGASRWLVDEPLTYDHSVAVVCTAGVATDAEKMAHAARAAVFWYSDRPAAGAALPRDGR